MILTGVIINLAAIVLGSAAGLLLKKGIPDRMGESVLKAMALCVIYIGISGTLDGENILIAIISMAVGTIIGEALSLQQRLEQLGGFIQSKCRPSAGGVSVAEGFVSASLLFCIGAMAIVGSLQSGLSLDHSTLTAKSLIDGIPFNDRDSNAMITALITGDKSGLPAHVGESFRISGASHILALSGMHLGVIYVILARTFSTFGNSPRAVLLRSSLVVAVSGYYTMMTGAGASIVRAFLFITLNEAARCTGRKRTPANVFCTSLMIQAALSPEVLESAGFQLSYLAMAGIYVLYPKMRSWYRETEPSGNSLSRRMTRYFSTKRLWDTAAMSISCQIFTAPAVWYHFGTFPPYFLISNLIAIPLSSLIINLSVPVIILEAAGICPEFLIRADEAAIKALCGSLEIVSGL